MFDNIGGKIKILAKVLCWVGIIGFVLSAIYVWVTIGRYGVGLGFALFIIGPLVSWISSFLLYGFGELIETNCEIAHYVQNYSSRKAFGGKVASDKTGDSAPRTEKSQAQLGTCEICKRQHVPLSVVNIAGDAGTEYRNVCSKCAEPYLRAAEKNRELLELLQSGLITEEEYEARKGEVRK